MYVCYVSCKITLRKEITCHNSDQIYNCTIIPTSKHK